MTQAAVEVRDVVRTFGDVRALDGVSLAFSAGVVYALLGPNGAGKTTLINVLATLLRPDSGEAFVSGVDVLADPAAVRRRIGLAGQFAAVDDYQTGRENVEMVGRLYGLSRADARRRATRVLEGFQLADAADRPVRGYSGGMRRRLDLAASLVGRPEVLFLDEPTTGIDPVSRADIWELIDELVDAGTTVLLTTQYLEEADQLADRIGVIDEGRLVTEGTADELKDRLGHNVVEVRVERDEAAAALAALRADGGLEPSDGREPGRLTVPAPNGGRTLIETVRRLDEAGIVPLDIGLHRPTLDDVFLSVAGRRGRRAGGAGGDDDGRPGRRRNRDRREADV